MDIYVVVFNSSDVVSEDDLGSATAMFYLFGAGNSMTDLETVPALGTTDVYEFDQGGSLSDLSDRQSFPIEACPDPSTWGSSALGDASLLVIVREARFRQRVCFCVGGLNAWA